MKFILKMQMEFFIKFTVNITRFLVGFESVESNSWLVFFSELDLCTLVDR